MYTIHMIIDMKIPGVSPCFLDTTGPFTKPPSTKPVTLVDVFCDVVVEISIVVLVKVLVVKLKMVSVVDDVSVVDF